MTDPPRTQNLPDHCDVCGAADPAPTMTAGVSYPLSPTSIATMWTLKAYCDACADALTLEAVAHRHNWGQYSWRLADAYGVTNPDQGKLALTKERFERV